MKLYVVDKLFSPCVISSFFKLNLSVFSSSDKIQGQGKYEMLGALVGIASNLLSSCFLSYKQK